MKHRKNFLLLGLSSILLCFNSTEISSAAENLTDKSPARTENHAEIKEELKYLRQRLDKLNDEAAKQSDISRIDSSLNDFVRRNEFDSIIKIAWATTLLALLIFVWLAIHAAMQAGKNSFPSPPNEILSQIPMASPAPLHHSPTPTPHTQDSFD